MSCRCDQCGVEGAKSAFKYCAACREAIYCGPECQRTHWKAGHKHKCVKQNKADTPAAPPPIPPPPPPIAVGAAVVISGIVSQPLLNGSRGSVTGGPDPETGRWAVRCAVDGKSRKLKPANLEVPLGGGAQSGVGGGGGGTSAAAGDEEECTICLEALQQPQTMPCGHRFCRGCVASMRQYGVREAQVCPLCRGPMPDAERLTIEASRLLAQHGKLTPTRHGGRNTAPQPAWVRDLLSKSIGLSREVLAIDPKHMQVHLNLGVALERHGDTDGAIAAFRAAIRVEPKYMNAHFNLATVLHRRGDLAGAEKASRAAIAVNPEFAKAHGILGHILMQAGNLAGAEVAFRAAIALDPPDVVYLHHNLGTLFLQKDDNAAAEAAFRAAVAANPRYAPANVNLGNCLQMRGDFTGAGVCYRAAIALDPTHANAHINLGSSLMHVGDMAGAEAAARAAIAANPQSTNARALLHDILARCGGAQHQSRHEGHTT
jgi:Flp pilus assembly protein TadD